MYLAAPAKINLGLHIEKKLPNGFHAIHSLFVAVSLFDIVEIVPSSSSSSSREHTLHTSGITIPGDHKDNLIFKLLHLLTQERRIPLDQKLDIYLHKQIPVGAGLGGGSSDVVAALKILDKMFSLALSDREKKEIVSSLGSDCSFFLEGRPALVSGVGDEISPIDFQFDHTLWRVLLFFPNEFISTVWAYQNFDKWREKNPSFFHLYDLKKVVQSPIQQWKNEIENDFEKAIFPFFPNLALAKDVFYNLGAVYASLSGSGSCIYAIFPTHTTPTTFDLLDQFDNMGYKVNKHQFNFVKILK